MENQHIHSFDSTLSMAACFVSNPDFYILEPLSDHLDSQAQISSSEPFFEIHQLKHYTKFTKQFNQGVIAQFGKRENFEVHKIDLEGLFENLDNLKVISSNFINTDTEFPYQNSAQIIESLVEMLETIFSEIVFYNNFGYIPASYIRKLLNDIVLHLDQAIPYLPDLLNEEFEKLTQRTYNFIYQDFEILINIDMLSNTVNNLLVFFERSQTQNSQKYRNLQVLLRDLRDSFNYFIGIILLEPTIETEKTIFKDQAKIYYKKIRATFDNLTQNNEFNVSEDDIHTMSKLFLLCDILIDQTF